MIAYLKLSDIQRITEMQPRAMIDMGVSEDYADDMKSGAKFPPLVVFHVGDDYILVDGFHRALAAQTAGLKKISCEVLEGTKRDAFLYASGVNSGHGLRRTNEDKKRAVERLLADPEWGHWSDSKIAEICKVSQPFVSKYRVHTSNIISMDSQPSDDNRTFIHPKTGKKSTMKTENIGKITAPAKEEIPDAQPDQKPAPKPDPVLPATITPPPHSPAVDTEKQKRERMEALAVELLSMYPVTTLAMVSEIMREHTSYKVKDVFYYGVQALAEQKSK